MPALIDKILGRITTWTIKFLSYARRLQLVQSVYEAVETFWAQVFVMPKKIIQIVKTLRKIFVWNMEVQTKGKALVAWDTIYRPKVVGGMNITNLYVWNKVTILKHLWHLYKKKKKINCGLYGYIHSIDNHGR